jgi:hypothetical protein
MSRCDALASELRLVKILSAFDVPKLFRPWFQKAAAAAQALRAERWRRRKATGDMIIVRYADETGRSTKRMPALSHFRQMT